MGMIVPDIPEEVVKSFKKATLVVSYEVKIEDGEIVSVVKQNTTHAGPYIFIDQEDKK